MNRVLNKDFVSGSYLNSALIIISGVFRPASCMQSCHVRESKGSLLHSFGLLSLQHTTSASHAGELMRSGNAC
jgi:hypothetical protein